MAENVGKRLEQKESKQKKAKKPSRLTKGQKWLLAMAIIGFIFSVVFIFSSPIFGGAFVVAFFSTAMIIYGVFRIWLSFKLRALKRAMMSE